ncbi:hypothetical protein F4604DRAFT_2010852 [Suillus subluteus]|nr:hypothetical protein F4604DRAFT_2010852 [Suillus subluteus]
MSIPLTTTGSNTTSISDEPSGVEDGSVVLSQMLTMGSMILSHICDKIMLPIVNLSHPFLSTQLTPFKQKQIDYEEAYASFLHGDRSRSTGRRERQGALGCGQRARAFHKPVPAMANRTTISGDAATRAGAVEALQENTWVHLTDITLLDIVEKDIPQAEFVFLSSCHAVIGDEETLNKVIHLAGELRSKIGVTSFWFKTSR